MKDHGHDHGNDLTTTARTTRIVRRNDRAERGKLRRTMVTGVWGPRWMWESH